MRCRWCVATSLMPSTTRCGRRCALHCLSGVSRSSSWVICSSCLLYWRKVRKVIWCTTSIMRMIASSTRQTSSSGCGWWRLSSKRCTVKRMRLSLKSLRVFAWTKRHQRHWCTWTSVSASLQKRMGQSSHLLRSIELLMTLIRCGWQRLTQRSTPTRALSLVSSRRNGSL